MKKNTIIWKYGTLLTLSVGSAFFLSLPAQAEEVDSFALSPEQLFNATVVSVSKTSEKLMDAPAAISVLTSEDIMRAGATSIPEALRLVPGVQVAQVNANSWAISVRGFNSTLANKLLVLIDGREVYDPLFSGVYWDIQDTVLEDIDRIEVVRGPGGTLWGDNAVNGVINIITKKAADTQGNLTSVIAGNQERGIVEERYGGKFGTNGYYRVYGKYLNRDDEETLAGTSDHDEWRAGRGGFRADWKSSDDSRDSFTVQGDVYRSRDGQLRFMPDIGSGTNPLTDENIRAQGANLLGRWTRELGDDSRFTLQSYVDFTSRDQLLIKDQRTSLDLDTQYEFPQMDRHKVIIGGRYRFSNDDLTATPDVTFTHNRDHDQIINGFIQDKITLEPKTWFLTLGSKLEYNNFSGVEVQPSAKLQWQPDETQMVWASIARAVRTPSRLEQDLHIVQAAFAGPITLDTFPNSGFDSEELIAYEIGHRKQWTDNVSTDITAFYNDYDKLTTFTSLGLLFPPPRFIVAFAPTNSTSGEVYGFETAVNWRARDNLNFSASYSFLDMQLHGPSSGALGAEAGENQSPDQQVSLAARWDVTKDVAFDTTLYYVSSVPDFAVKDYLRLDMRLGWRITDGLQFDLVGQNLLDPEHQEFTSPTDPHVLATEIGRSIYGKLTWRF